jgi:hypothetical protein
MNYLIYQYWNIFYENFKEMFDKIKTVELEDYEVVLLGE